MTAQYFKRSARVAFGLALCAMSSYFSIQAGIGLAPWEALSMGLSYVTPFTYGQNVILVGVLIIGIDLLMKEKIGIGTLLDTLLVGAYVDLYRQLGFLPAPTSFPVALIMLLIGQLFRAVGVYFYMSAALSCGPRDSMMVGIARRIPRVPVGVVQGMVEGTALLVGYLLGATVGVGTIVAVFGIGFALELVFHIFKFDPRAMQHESLVDTFHIVAAHRAKPAAEHRR